MADFTAIATPAQEWLDFAKTWTPPSPPPGASLQEAREAANNGRAKLFTDVLGKPDGLDIIDENVPTSDGHLVPVRIYRPLDATGKLPVYISLHGGGWYLGSLESEDPSSRHVALHTGAAVVSVNYRHTPEWVFPTQVNDAWDVFNWVHQFAEKLNFDAAKIIIGGVSAGASLAAATVLRETGQNGRRARGLILSIPATVDADHFPKHLVKDGYSSLEQNADAPFISLTALQKMAALYKPDPTSPYYSPLLQPEETFRNFPPTSFHIAGWDPLRDEGLLLHDKFNKAGVSTELVLYPGFPHGFMSFPQLKVAQKWSQNIYADIRRLAGQETAVDEVGTHENRVSIAIKNGIVSAST